MTKNKPACEDFFRKYKEITDDLFEKGMEHTCDYFGLSVEEGREVFEEFINNYNLRNLNVNFQYQEKTKMVKCTPEQAQSELERLDKILIKE